MVIETPDIYPVNLVAQYHLLEDESAKWANKTGGKNDGNYIFTTLRRLIFIYDHDRHTLLFIIVK